MGGALTGRALLEELGPALQLARSLRYEKDDAFVDVTTDELERAARSLRAISYSCSEGARRLDRVRAARGPVDPVPTPASEPGARVADLLADLEESVQAARAAREAQK